MIDYQQEFIKFLNNNPIYNLPSQEIIDENEEVALLVWRKYHPFDQDESEYLSSEEKYSRCNWSHVLAKYAQNEEFWFKALINRGYKTLLNQEFQHDFPKITQAIFNSNDKLLELYKESKDLYFLKKMKISQHEFDEIYKEHLSEQWNISQEDLCQYESDSNFVTKVLKKHPKHYCLLNEENKKTTHI